MSSLNHNEKVTCQKCGAKFSNPKPACHKSLLLINDIPVFEGLLTLDFLLYDIDIVGENSIGEHVGRSVQKHGDTVQPLRNNNHKYFESNNNAVFQRFDALKISICWSLFVHYQTWSTFAYLNLQIQKPLPSLRQTTSCWIKLEKLLLVAFLLF